MTVQPALWSRISATVEQEFSDVADVEQITRIVLRLALAALLGGLMGFERASKGKDAGVRTHMLVCMGAAMFMLVSQQAGMLEGDLSRVVQGVIAGVGFLGAGTILKSDDEQRVKGLTTAAGIWLTAAVGVAAGMGRETTAVACALLALATLGALPMMAAMVHKVRPGHSTRSATAATWPGQD